MATMQPGHALIWESFLCSNPDILSSEKLEPAKWRESICYSCWLIWGPKVKVTSLVVIVTNQFQILSLQHLVREENDNILVVTFKREALT